MPWTVYNPKRRLPLPFLVEHSPAALRGRYAPETIASDRIDDLVGINGRDDNACAGYGRQGSDCNGKESHDAGKKNNTRLGW